MTAGHGTNDVLAALPGCDAAGADHQGPAERGEVLQPARRRAAHQFTSDAMPVIAYLDTGIYCHPIVDGLVDAVKIGYYNPPDMPRERAPASTASPSFVEQCMPGLRDARGRATSRTSTSATTTWSPTTTSCSAPIPGFANVVRRRRLARHRLQVRALGRARARPSSRCSGGTVYDIGRFDPARFVRRESTDEPSVTRTLEQRLADGVVVGAEGYVFELERRGYIKAGPYVPEVILDEPDALRAAAPRVPARRLGRDGRAHLLRAPREAQGRRPRRRPRGDEPPGGADRQRDRRRGRRAGRRQHLQHLVLRPGRPEASGAVVRAQYEEQLGWAVEEGVDFVIAETNDYVGEALIGLEVCKELGLPAHGDVRERAAGARRTTATTTSRRAGSSPTHGAAVVGLNCSRGPATMLPLLERIRAAVDIPVAAQPVPVPHVARDARRSSRWRRPTASALFPIQLEPFQCTRFEMAEFARQARDIGVDYIGICCGGGAAPRARDGRGARPRHAGQPLLARRWSCTRCSAPRASWAAGRFAGWN